MDLDAMKSGFGLLKEAIAALKELLALFPKGSGKDAAQAKLAEAERNMLAAEARIAVELGYPLCRCSWPPQIMLLLKPPHEYRCGKCGHSLDMTPEVLTVRSAWRDRMDGF